MWTSDSLNLIGSIRFVKASFNLLAYARLAYGVISSHHIISGLLGTSIGLWHITLRPLAYLYNLLSMGKVESILSSSITAVFFTASLFQPLSNPAKGGLFRSGPMLKADGLFKNWLAMHASPWVHYP